MIYFPLLGQMGRLGNQLFQVAAALAHAERCKTELLLPAWPYGKYFAGPWKEGTAPAETPVFKEPSYNYSSLVTPNSSHSLEGYFQSEKYFSDQEPLIRKTLAWNKEELQAVHTGVVTDPSRIHIALHVRRGDFLTFADKFPPLPDMYYDQALLVMRNILDAATYLKPPVLRFHVFSDDMEWCKQHLDFGIRWGTTIEVVYHEQRNQYKGIPPEIVDLYLMSHCQHFIIANSSFSWWGAWLGAGVVPKIVVSPSHKNWFGPANGFYNQTQDLLPEKWAQIDI